jgi:hypothetical protein
MNGSPSIALEKVCYVVIRAREFDARYATDEPDASNASEDGFRDTLAARRHDPTVIELVEFIGAMDADELAEMVALLWVGRGDFSKDEWDAAVALARERRDNSTVRYLLGTPLLGDLLMEGLALFDLGCTEMEARHL